MYYLGNNIMDEFTTIIEDFETQVELENKLEYLMTHDTVCGYQFESINFNRFDLEGLNFDTINVVKCDFSNQELKLKFEVEFVD